MRISNMHHFTENHRFYVYREFALGVLELKMLTSIYQPMIGAYAISIYQTLAGQVPADRLGYSELEQQRKLFLALDLEPGERGRKIFIETTSKLEAVGLLQTTRRYFPAIDDYMYEYQLLAPLAPDEFFKNQHLVMLLRDKVGKYAVLALRESFQCQEPEELADPDAVAENISVPFYDLFQLNTSVIDFELEQALYETAPTRERSSGLDVTSKAFHYTEIITRFPRESANRPFVEALRYEPQQMIAINMTARKFSLTLQDTVRLLDEDGVFDEAGELQVDLLQYKANMNYRQGRKRDEERERHIVKAEAAAEAVRRSNSRESSQWEGIEEKTVEMSYYLEVPTLFIGQCDIHQYNALLRNEPYTQLLSRFFPKGTVPKTVADIFDKIDINYKLPDEVINVMIHHLHVYKESSWTKGYIDSVASNMLAKGVGTYEQAVEYIREQTLKRTGGRDSASAAGKDSRTSTAAPGGRRSYNNGRAGNAQQSQKPKISIITDIPTAPQLTQEQLEEMRRRAQKLDGKLKK
ncbi:DnaD domain protein [Paenibacillus koleovorans]|uniref:DnaD domain protein n=1 Tax=Paenibacillus koleovorans TaxID=121608 RepID=UPI000FDA56BC|nr:DnaD domain protein [Paenibacillus koleovorans]